MHQVRCKIGYGEQYKTSKSSAMERRRSQLPRPAFLPCRLEVDTNANANMADSPLNAYGTPPCKQIQRMDGHSISISQEFYWAFPPLLRLKCDFYHMKIQRFMSHTLMSLHITGRNALGPMGLSSQIMHGSVIWDLLRKDHNTTADSNTIDFDLLIPCCHRFPRPKGPCISPVHRVPAHVMTSLQSFKQQA